MVRFRVWVSEDVRLLGAVVFVVDVYHGLLMSIDELLLF